MPDHYVTRANRLRSLIFLTAVSTVSFLSNCRQTEAFLSAPRLRQLEHCNTQQLSWIQRGMAARRATVTNTMNPVGAEERVVIVGGGIVGASTAYHLSLRGVKALVLERSKVAAAASGKAGGFLAGGWGSGPTVRMHEVSFNMHEHLAEELGVTSYRKIPTLQVSGARKGKSPAPWLDGQASGTMMDPATAQVTPLELTTKLMEAAQARGAELRIGAVAGVSTAPVAGVSEGGEEKGEGGDGERRVTGVLLGDGEEIPCDRPQFELGAGRTDRVTIPPTDGLVSTEGFS